MHEVVPVAVAQLGRVELEGGEEVLGVTRRQAALGERCAQAHGDLVVVVAADQARFEPIEHRQLVGRGERRMIGDIVGGADEIIERQDHLAVARMNQKRGDRKILVPVSLAGPPIAGVAHARIRHRGSETLNHTFADTLAWARPFHMPPRPRAC